MPETTMKGNESAGLLIELGCEELPPKALDKIREAFFNAVIDGLENNNIVFDLENSRSFSTPRRLGLYFDAVATGQPDQDLERRGPATRAAFDSEGNPTGAALGFARSVGKDVSELETIKSDKGEWLYAKVHQPGKPLSELIFPVLELAVRQLPVPKPMRWADHDFSFVRPVHWLVVMHGEQVLNGHLLGQASGCSTRGHRIHSPGPHRIPSSRDYTEILLQSFVMADHTQRKEHIRRIVEQAEPDVLIDPDLLNEVNNLVEWPIAVACAFEEEFLEVPHAALIASMQDHQKFFPVRNNSDPKLVTNRFVGVANVESTNISAVREGYERVIRPRLADARFFLEQDQKQTLESYLPRLEHVVFQEKIGTIGNKSDRISTLSKNISNIVAGDPVVSGRAARLAKCDLVTHMIGEFPELQGLMGQQYALSSGESQEVAAAIAEHYAPRFAGDDIPPSNAGRIVSIADRLDTLVGIFAAGLRPTGNKDPFALRRSALGLVRILIEAEFDISVETLLKLAANELSNQIEVTAELLAEVRDFVVERLRHYYREQGYTAELINAAIATNFDTLPDLDRRLKAIAQFMGQEEAQSLAAANKRIGNILRKAGESDFANINEDRLVLSQERHLFDEVSRLGDEVTPLLEDGDYLSGLLLLASLKTPVDEFFDSVMVMDENPALRANRLALLNRLKSLFDQIADLSVLG